MTDTTITIGAISTLSGPAPGFGESALAAVRAYVEYRNSTGGVCGRQLELRAGDDGADNGRYRSLVQELDGQVLGIAGGIAIGDAGGADIVASSQIPVVTTAVNDVLQDAPTVFDINPPFADVNVATGKYRFLADSGVRTAAVVYVEGAAGRSEMQQKQIPQMEAAGIQVVLEQALPLSTLSYDAAARAVANSGADYFLFLHEVGASAAMARAIADTDYRPMFAEYITGYAPSFIGLAGPAAEGAVSWIRSLPNEDAGSNAEQSAFLEWLAQTAPDSGPDTFAADAWAAAKAMADALEALQGPITRPALIDQLRATATFDAGGFLGPIQLGAKLNNGCSVAMIVEGGVWRRLTPASGFVC